MDVLFHVRFFFHVSPMWLLMVMMTHNRILAPHPHTPTHLHTQGSKETHKSAHETHMKRYQSLVVSISSSPTGSLSKFSNDGIVRPAVHVLCLVCVGMHPAAPPPHHPHPRPNTPHPHPPNFLSHPSLPLFPSFLVVHLFKLWKKREKERKGEKRRKKERKREQNREEERRRERKREKERKKEKKREKERKRQKER
jgi:hypothetical protein